MLGRVSRVQAVYCSEGDYLCSSKMNRASMVLMLLLCRCSSFGLGCEVRDGVGLSAGVSKMMQARFDPAGGRVYSARREPQLLTWPTPQHGNRSPAPDLQGGAQAGQGAVRRLYALSRGRCAYHTTVDSVKLELTCLAGSATFVGLGAFTYVSGHSQLKAQEAVIRQSKSMFGMGSRRAAITTTSAVFVGLGVYRWFA